LVGTAIGSVVGMLVINARIWHPPEILILATAMLPLALFITLFERYRTAPVAAIIILSSAGSVAAPMNIALCRMLEVTIGSLVSVGVSRVILPSHTQSSHVRMGCALAVRFAALLVRWLEPRTDRTEWDAAHEQLRRDLRELAALVKARTSPKRHGAHALRMLKLVSQMQADVAFVTRITPTLAAPAHQHHLEAARIHAVTLQDACCDLVGVVSGQVAREVLKKHLLACSAALEAARHSPAVLNEASDTATPPDMAHAPQVTTLYYILETLNRDFLDLARLVVGGRSQAS